MENLQQIISQPQTRTITLQREAVSQTDRTIEFSCSSETPVERWFGREILDHNPESIRMGRLMNAAPLLHMHDPYRQIGVVERAWLDDKEKKLRISCKFSKNSDADEIFQDVQDEIVRNVSIGYRVHKFVLESKSDDEETYRATDWEPYEVSIVSVPADDTVGVGRSQDMGQKISELENKINQIKIKESRTMEPENNIPQQPDTAQDEARKQAAEVKRRDEIKALGTRKNVAYEWAIETGVSIEQYRGYVLDHLGNSEPLYTPPSELGLSRQEKNDYSITRAIRAQITSDWGKAGYERELSDEIAKRNGHTARGFFVPTDVFTRDLTATGTGAKGGYLVGTNLQASSFIELLTNKMLAKQLGARVMSGLVGNVAISRKTATGTAAWVGEGSVSKSDMSLGQIVLSPKTIAAFEQYSKQLLLQGTPATDQLVNDDILTILALGIDKGIFHGTGSANQPQGIVGTSGINSVTGTSFDWATAISYQTKVETANALAGNLAYVTTPAIRGTLKSRSKATNYPDFICGSDNNCAGFRMEATNQITDGHVIFGDFSQVIIGEWGVIDIVVDPFTLAADNLIRVIAHENVDIAIRQPGAFSVSTSFS